MSEFFEVDAQPVIAAMKLALVKDVTPKDDIAEDEESPQALAKATRKSCKSYWLLVNSPQFPRHFLVSFSAVFRTLRATASRFSRLKKLSATALS